METAKDSELPLIPVLLDTVTRRGFRPDVCVMDRGYDAEVIYDETESRHMRPVVPLRQTPAVKAGKDKPPSCDHGEWTFAGSDAKRGASKWHCPEADAAQEPERHKRPLAPGAGERPPDRRGVRSGQGSRRPG